MSRIKLNENFIKNIHKYILNGLKPNLTFVLKVSSKSSNSELAGAVSSVVVAWYSFDAEAYTPDFASKEQKL